MRRSLRLSLAPAFQLSQTPLKIVGSDGVRYSDPLQPFDGIENASKDGLGFRLAFLECFHAC